MADVQEITFLSAKKYNSLEEFKNKKRGEFLTNISVMLKKKTAERLLVFSQYRIIKKKTLVEDRLILDSDTFHKLVRFFIKDIAIRMESTKTDPEDRSYGESIFINQRQSLLVSSPLAR